MSDAAIRSGYSSVHKLFHWAIAVLVITTIPLSVIMGNLPEGPTQNAAYNLHKSLGVLILALMVGRLVNRLVQGAPPPEPTLAGWQRVASWLVHTAFYPLLLAMPLLGWAATSAYGANVPVFGLFDLPPLLPKNKQLSDALFQTHQVLGFVTAGLATLHISAALYHRFIRHDGVFARMAPRF